MVLADLHARLDRRGRGNVAVGAQRCSQGLDGGQRGVGFLQLGEQSDDRLNAMRGEGVHGFEAGDLEQVREGLVGELVIGMVERGASFIGEREDAGRTPSPPRAVDALFARAQQTAVDELGQMAADRGRGQIEFLSQLGRSRRAHGEDGLEHPVTGRHCVCGVAPVRVHRVAR